MGIWDKLLAWFYSLMIILYSGVRLTVDAAMIAIMLALFLVVVDFVTGVTASKHEGATVKIKSKKMRWSFAKLLVYAGAVAFTLVVGVGLHAIEIIMNPEMSTTDTLRMTLYCVRVEAYFICWIETVSIIENLRRKFPDIRFLKILHYIVAVEFIKRIPKLEKALKETDTKNICEEFESKDRTELTTETMSVEDSNESSSDSSDAIGE